MKTRFINMEGLHGSGKTTYAWKLYQYMKADYDVEVYFEYDSNSTIQNPCDIRMTAVMNEDEFRDLYKRNTEFEQQLKEKVCIYGGFYCIFMPDFKEDENLEAMLRTYIADDGIIDKHKFIGSLKGKVKEFVELALENDKIYIFENVLFQQILNEFMRSLSCSEEEMMQYIHEVLHILSPLNPTLFYLNPVDLKVQIDRIANERLSDNYDLYPDWIDWMVEYLKKSEYGRKNAVQSREDLMNYFRKRYELEKRCFEQLQIANKHMISIDGMNYNENEKKIIDLTS